MIWMTWLAVVALKCGVLLAVGWCVAAALRDRAPALVAGIATAALAAVLLMPLIDGVTPGVVRVARPGWSIMAPANEHQEVGVSLRGVGADESEPGLIGPSRREQGYPWPALGLAIWVVGAGLVLVPYLLSLGRLRVAARRGRPLPASASGCAAARTAGTVLVSDRVTGILVFGPLRPTILVPPAATEWSSGRLTAALLHERAHVLRRDPLIDLLAQIVLALHWFNPFAWLLVRKLRHARELACDADVVRAGVERWRYARYLLEAAGPRTVRPNAHAGLGEHPVVPRIRAVLQASAAGPRSSISHGMARVVGVSALVTMAVLGAIEARTDATASVELEFPARTSPVAATDVGPSSVSQGPDASGPVRRAINRLMAAEPRARWQAAAVLGNAGDSRGVEPLMRALQDPHHRVREYAAAALGNIGDDRAGRPLARLLRDADEDVRQRAAGALGAVGGSSAAPMLVAALRDPEPHVRQVAAGSLARVGGPLALPALADLARDDEDAHVRAVAAEGVRRLR